MNRRAPKRQASRGSAPRTGKRQMLPGNKQAQAKQQAAKKLAAKKKAAAVAAPVEALPTIQLGFVRGVAPSKWADRWARAVPEQPLELVPVDLHEVATARETLDVLLERVPHGATPIGSGDMIRSRHAMQLYEEKVALVVPADHELAKRESVDLDELALVALIDHPDHLAEWPKAQEWKDPSWMPKNAKKTLELVATGLGGALMAQPLARHLSEKRSHAVIPVVDGATSLLPGTEIWATWRVERDGNDVQHLVGVLRGRTARSSR